MGFPNGSAGKESTCNAGDTEFMVQTQGQEDPRNEENGSPLHYSCLKNPLDRGAWRAAVHRITKSKTRLSH